MPVFNRNGSAFTGLPVPRHVTRHLSRDTFGLAFHFALPKFPLLQPPAPLRTPTLDNPRVSFHRLLNQHRIIESSTTDSTVTCTAT
jgi:hypothetical protein